MARFERRAEAERAAKENLRVKSELEKEKINVVSKFERSKHDLRASWDHQMEERAKRTDLERYGQERSLTSLNMPDMDPKSDELCCRCSGPMPDGIRIKVPNRVRAGIKA